ncbi:tudor domain-containing protein 7 isoform X2 [Venturia canescens]|nr:tudor domain-containing protein 7 isoform X2 [Venturia canescens]
MNNPVRPPPTTNGRFAGNADFPSASKPLVQRVTQPRQELDYLVRPKMGPVSSDVEGQKVANSPVPEPPRAQESPKVVSQPFATFNPPAANAAAPRPMPEVKPPLLGAPTNPFQLNSGNSVRPQFSQPLLPNPMLPSPINPMMNVPMPMPFPWQRPPSRLRVAERMFSQRSANQRLLQIQRQSQAPTNGATPSAPVLPLQDPREELKKIARELGRPEPVYKIIPVQGKGGSMVYGKVEIGSSKFSSYPEEAQTPEAAEILAAREALKDLKKEHATTLRLVPTTNKDVMKKRLLEIVDHHTGVFIHKIPALYQEEFKENLPSDWMEEIAQWNEVDLENGVNDSVILIRAVLTANSKAPVELSPVTEKSFLKPIYSCAPGNVTLPDEHVWVAHVTYVISPVEIWVRLVGENYSDKLDAMRIEMKNYYSTVKTPAEHIEPNGYYAMMENETWYRVRVLECDLSCDEADILFIDLGEDDTVNVSRLYPLNRKFYSLPAQAMRVSLIGLEDFADCESAVVPIIEKHILEGVFYMEDFSRDVDEFGPLASVIMYDTEGPVDIDLNDLIVKKILENIAPRFESPGQITAVHASHIQSNGDVFIQVKSDTLKTLTKLLNKLVETGISNDERLRYAVDRIDSHSIYLARCNESGDWYRAKFVEMGLPGESNSRPLKMFVVDFGRTILVDMENVLQLEKMSSVLARFPAQAVKIALDKLESNMFSSEMVTRLRELAPASQVLILKVVKPSVDGSVPVVELFKRSPPDNILGSINNTLVHEYEGIKIVDEDGNNNVKPRKLVERVNSRSTVDIEENAKALPAPKIGEVGEYFNVHVTMAANPANFTVQPLESKEELKNLMVKLQKVCQDLKDSHPPLDSVREGRLYAAQHSDGSWYRGCVLNVIDKQVFTVYFIDYGDVAVVWLDKLLPLSRQFLDLPYQAIKARLVGIKPKRIDWSPEDCVRFQNLVVERALVSVVQEVDADRHLPRDTVLGLSLIDVSTAEDVYIGDVLVKEGRAVYV